MNTMMWEHPFTQKHLKVLEEELGFIVIDTVVKKLICEDTGKGAMAEIPTIVDMVIKQAIQLRELLQSDRKEKEILTNTQNK